MILDKYNEFINESAFLELLNEGIVQASSDFIDKLRSIGKQNRIAKVLADAFEREYYISSDQNYNYIDVTKEEDMVSFISDRKGVNEDDPYIAKGRGTIKIGRLVNGILSNKDMNGYFFNDEKVTSQEIETFVNLYKSSTINNTNEFKIVRGDDIAHWYEGKRYKSGSGQLNNSCMADVDSQFFDIYVKNPKVCRMLIYLNDKKELMGRALLWRLDESPVEGVKWFMDRIYTVRDSDINRFKEYARNEGWLYKYKNTYDHEEGVLFYHGATPVIGKISIQLRKWDFDDFPFVDTVSFFDKKNGRLSNVGVKKAKLLNDTNGSWSFCDVCDGDGKFDDEKCTDCVGILKCMIDRVKEGSYKEFKNYLPK